MAGNNLATMLTRNTSKILPVLVYVFVEWVLIILLFSNSVFSYLLRKFALYFGLEQPCIFCSRVDHFLESTETRDPYNGLICETHAYDISKLAYCTNHQRLAELRSMCEECLPSDSRYCENAINSSSDIAFCRSEDSEEISRCSCCEKRTTFYSRSYFRRKGTPVVHEIEDARGESKLHDDPSASREHQILSASGSTYLREAAEADSNGESERVNLDEESLEHLDSAYEDDLHTLVPDVKAVGIMQLDGHSGRIEREHTASANEILPDKDVDDLLDSADGKETKAYESLHRSQTEGDNDDSFTIKQLKSELEVERKARNDLYAGLKAEIGAAAISANQTITRLQEFQEEKTNMQMEALHYERVMENQAEHDQEAMQLLNELVAKRELEKHEIQKELDRHRERILDYEAKDKARMTIQKCGNFSSSCSIDNDSDVLSIDLHCRYKRGDDNKDTSLLDCSKQWGEIEESLEELEEERLSVIKQLKKLEHKLYKSEEQEKFKPSLESVRAVEHETVQDQGNDPIEPNVDLCSREVNSVSFVFSTAITADKHPKTMASVAQMLLDLVESDDAEMEDKAFTAKQVDYEKLAISSVDQEIEKRAIEKEMDHVYGRLKALEADSEFLRHCIGSLNKGNEGVNLLQEILQHLRELRDA